MDFRRQLSTSLLLLSLALISGCSEDPSIGRDSSDVLAEASEDEMKSDSPSGETIFRARCASCHTDPDNRRAPELRALARLNTAHIAFALTNGTMKVHAEGLGIGQIIDVAGFISDIKTPHQPDQDKFCADQDINTTAVVGRWGINAENTATLADGASAINSENVARLELAWAFGLPDTSDARSQPVITQDTLFIAVTSGHLFALDRASGCIKWHTTLAAPPRTALTLGTTLGAMEEHGRSVLFFGDTEAHIVAVDALSGELVWRADAAISEHSFLTGAPVQHEQRLIVPVSLSEVILALDPNHECCKSHGAVLAMDVNTGERLWVRELTDPAQPQGLTEVGTQRYGPSGVPVWSTPTVDTKRRLIYVGTGQNASLPATDYSDAVIALDLATGEVAWHFQAIAGDAYNGACDQRPKGPNCPKWQGPDHDIGASVILARNSSGQDILLAGQKSGDVYALDPDEGGRLIWQQRPGAGSFLGGVHWGMAYADGKVFAPISDPAFPMPGYYPKPGLYALDVDDGTEVWSAPVERGCETNVFDYFSRESLYPDCSFYYGLSAAPVVVNDLVFSASLDGRIRAFSVADGQQAWGYDTLRGFDTVNGVEAHGGSIDVAGVQAADRMIYVQSGYSMFGQLPGNVLLAFSIM
jgi:polyvinyl alcohol dehydrogenase (cytochrome)